MTVQIILVFLLPVLIGAFLVHVLWPARELWSLVFKAFLGIGIGLGAWSLLYFIYLLSFAGQHWFMTVEVVVLLVLIGIAIWQDRKQAGVGGWFRDAAALTRVQRVALAFAGLVFSISLLSAINYLLRRRQGDWDAWMMYNRAARFMYLDETHWTESFSPQMDPIFHPDYPLLLAMNIASGWQELGRDNPRIPMVQSGLFAIACAGLLASGLAAVKSTGQAALGLVLLWGIPEFVNEGARQMADVPLAFYMLGTGVLLYLYVMDRRPGLAVLAGLTTGLAAWTKNEGIVMVLGALAGVAIALVPRYSWRPLLFFVIGLAVPLIIVLLFKIGLAPPGDILSKGRAPLLDLITDPARHLEILNYLGQEILYFGNWGIAPIAVGILPLLVVYLVVFHAPAPAAAGPAFLALGTILVIQMVGDYVAYLISPYDLAWHLSYSTTRLVLQIFPLVLFLVMCISSPLEAAFGSASTPTHGVHHASGN